MAEELLVDSIDAGRDFLAAFDRSYPVSVAYWVLPAESDRWQLHIASDQFTPDTMNSAYGIANPLAMRPPRRLDWMQLRLMSCQDPFTAKVVEIRDTYGRQFATRFNGRLVAGIPVDGLYIYEARDGVPGWNGRNRRPQAVTP